MLYDSRVSQKRNICAKKQNFTSWDIHLLLYPICIHQNHSLIPNENTHSRRFAMKNSHFSSEWEMRRFRFVYTIAIVFFNWNLTPRRLKSKMVAIITWYKPALAYKVFRGDRGEKPNDAPVCIVRGGQMCTLGVDSVKIEPATLYDTVGGRRLWSATCGYMANARARFAFARRSLKFTRGGCSHSDSMSVGSGGNRVLRNADRFAGRVDLLINLLYIRANCSLQSSRLVTVCVKARIRRLA